MKIYIYIILIQIAYFLFFESVLWADVISLNDGSVINGIIIQMSDDKIVLKNSFGTFNIDRIYLKSYNKTSTYKEDIRIIKSKGLNVDQTEIKENFLAGLRSDIDNKNTANEVLKRIQLSGSYLFALGKLEQIFNHGNTIYLSYEQPTFSFMEKIGIRYFLLDAGYVSYNRSDKQVYGPSILAGPKFFFPYKLFQNGDLTAEINTGISFTTYKSDFHKGSSNTFTFNAAIGYEYLFSNIILGGRIRFNYLYDIDVPLYGLGFELSFGFTL